MALTSLLLLAFLQAAASPLLKPADQSAAFKAAGFSLKAGKWRSDCDQPGVGSYQPGSIEQARDLNGDGRPEAIIVEGSLYCYGNTAAGFALVSKQANGDWKRVFASQGIPTVLTTKGVGRWPDIEVGGPGFCSAVWRWDGREYAVHRFQYERKPCRPPR